MTYKELLDEGVRRLSDAQILEASTDAWRLMQFVFKISRLDYLMNPQKNAADALKAQYEACILKRSTHYPLQYITNEQNFMGLDFYVDERVLIPRQDTEVLVEEVLEYLKSGMSVLDMCTGSGCIITSLAANKKLSCAVGADLSDGALTVASGNAAANGQKEIMFVKSDLFENIDGCFDIIVSNPPYIPSGDIDGLMHEVGAHEPRMALDGSGDGLLFYRKITETAPSYLNEGGMLFFEIGWNQAADICILLEKAGFAGITVKQDLAGLDRVVYGHLL